MSFEAQMKEWVKGHGATNNAFLRRFAGGEASRTEVERFAVEFYHFSRTFPVVLCSLLVNTPDEEEARELTKILASELGDGDPDQRHELLYRAFLRSIGIEPAEVVRESPAPATKAWIGSQLALYGGRDHFAGLGASFALEEMAIPMWDRLIPGLRAYKERWFPDMDLTYFTFHRDLEEEHEDAMEAALALLEGDEEVQASFRRGAEEVLAAEEAFWRALLDSGIS